MRRNGSSWWWSLEFYKYPKQTKWQKLHSTVSLNWWENPDRHWPRHPSQKPQKPQHINHSIPFTFLATYYRLKHCVYSILNHDPDGLHAEKLHWTRLKPWNTKAHIDPDVKSPSNGEGEENASIAANDTAIPQSKNLIGNKIGRRTCTTPHGLMPYFPMAQKWAYQSW